MNRLEAWLLHLSTIVLSLTGILYAWMRYMMKPVDPFSVVNHPLEPVLLKSHILVAPLLLLGLGMILHAHILFKIGTGTRTAKRTGIVLIPTFVVMVISGYMLQVISSDFRKALVIIHLVSGGLWALIYIGHQAASYAQRRVRTNGRTGARFPVPVVLVFMSLAFTMEAQAEKLERQVYSMGTTLRVVTLEQNHEKALQDTEALIRVIEDADHQLSNWKKNSELSLLNVAPAGVEISLSPSLFSLLREIKNWTHKTNGAFDPGIGNLIQVWGIPDHHRFPANAEIQSALSRSGLKYLILNEKNGTVTKTREILIDPGAFGKGEALDRAIELAVSRRMAPVLLDFGGQIAVRGVPENKSGWIAYLADPEKRIPLEIDNLVLRSGSLSTSGFSERAGKVGDRMINHILDPVTGQAASSFGSVTVWHPEAMTADILSTALYVMGVDKGYNWAVQNGIAAAFLTGDQILKTPEFLKEFFSPQSRGKR